MTDPAQDAFARELREAELLLPSGVAGVDGLGTALLDLRTQLVGLLHRSALGESPIRWSFPAVLPTAHLEVSGYFGSFPQLAATVSPLVGDGSGLAMVPAACHPVYPALAGRGPIPRGGQTVQLDFAPAFRHEPSADPARLQAFSVFELVRCDGVIEVVDWRDRWTVRSAELLSSLGLDVTVVTANDPFFGRQGRLLAAGQREQGLKVELQVPVAGPELTAVGSLNAHLDHFSGPYGLVAADGSPVHTACLGFGLERVCLALLARHGLRPASWPAPVRGLLCN